MDSRHSKHGQVSMEIMAYMGFFMLIFVFILISMLSDFNSDITRRQFTLAKQTAGQIEDYTQFISKAGPGYWGNFSIPKNVNGRPYIIRFVSSGWLYVEVEGEQVMAFSSPTAHSNILPGWSALDKPAKNSHSTYIDSDGILRQNVVVDGSKGWLFFNYTTAGGSPAILVK